MNDIRLEFGRLLIPLIGMIAGFTMVLKNPESTAGGNLLSAGLGAYFGLATSQVGNTRVEKADTVQVNNESSPPQE